MQILRLWYPYLSLRECELLAEAAPSGHPPQEQTVDTSRTWDEADIALMRREFAMLDVSGDGSVDRHVRHPPLPCPSPTLRRSRVHAATPGSATPAPVHYIFSL